MVLHFESDEDGLGSRPSRLEEGSSLCLRMQRSNRRKCEQNNIFLRSPHPARCSLQGFGKATTVPYPGQTEHLIFFFSGETKALQ